MGSSNQWRIDIDITDVRTLNIVLERGRQLDPGKNVPTWDQFAFRKWSERTKWDPCDLLKMLSREYPQIVFSAAYNGDYGAGKIFFFDGEEIEASEIWIQPAFPSRPLIKKALANKKKKDAVAKVAREKEAAAKEAAAKEARIKALEAELLKLKAQNTSLTPMDLSEQHG